MNKKVNIQVDASKRCGTQEHLWRWIGYDECNYTYIPEGKELLRKFAALGDAPYYFRTHFMFCTGNCHGTYKFGSTNIYWEDPEGNSVYDFTYYDKIMDSYMEAGHKPFVELGFMPQALVDEKYLLPKEGNWDRYNQYKDVGWTCPPKDCEKGGNFIKALISHLLERYGEEEVKTWYFELWNEPDIFYWNGTIAEYCKLYDYTERAIHEVCDELRISGPAVTGNFDREYVCRFFRDFLKHCKSGVNFCTGETGTRLDFITYHVKGGGFPFEMHAQKAVPSVERVVYHTKLGLDIIKECGYQGLEVVLSEADPDGWAAGGVYDNANMIFRNTEYYATYVASTYEKIEQLCHEYRMAVRPLAWAFMFPGERCFEGTRTFTTQGIDKAVFNLFKIYGSLGDTKLAFSSDGAETMEQVEKQFMKMEASKPYTGEGEETDVSGFAVEGKNGETQIVFYSHNNDRDEHSESTVTLTVEGLSGKETVECIHYRIDGEHSNPYAEWKRQGEPLFPEGEQYEAIKKRDGLEKLTEDTVLSVKDGAATLTFTMPAHAVSFVVLK